MKINTKNTAKIEAALATAQAAVTARTVDADDVTDAVERIEAKLVGMLLKKDWVGLRFIVDPHAQDFPACYRGIPDSTGFVLERCASGWFMTRVIRSQCRAKNYRIQALNMSDKKDELAEFAEQGKFWRPAA